MHKCHSLKLPETPSEDYQEMQDEAVSTLCNFAKTKHKNSKLKKQSLVCKSALMLSSGCLCSHLDQSDGTIPISYHIISFHTSDKILDYDCRQSHP